MPSPARTRRFNIALSIFCGLLVACVAIGVHLATIPHEPGVLLHIALGDVTAGLVAIIIFLALQLKNEETHRDTSIERALIVSELNHHVRNAIFPLCLTVHKAADKEAAQTADAAVERINLVLREATTDAITGRLHYGEEK